MKRLPILMITILCIVPVVTACMNDREVDGYLWSFHRMEDGNSYHECKLERLFQEGSSISMNTPCLGYHVDAIQVEWDDNKGKMSGSLIVFPNRKDLGQRDISSKTKRVTWTVQRNVNRIEFNFGGPRDQRARVNWIRVFYGKNSQVDNSIQGKNQKKEEKIDATDKIKFKKGPRERKARVVEWTGSKFIVYVDRGGNRLIKRELEPEIIDYILFKHRWGKATGHNGISVPFKAKRFSKNMLWFDKKEGSQIISKTQYPIEKFRHIVFHD